MYSSYKKLRNFVSDMNRDESLEVIWQLSTKQCHKSILKGIYFWEEEILSREIILNSSLKTKKSLRDVSSLDKCIDYIRFLSDFQEKDNLEDSFELLNSVQRSFRQQSFDYEDFTRTAYRCLKLYSHPALKEKMLEENSLSILEIFYIGIMLFNHFNKRSYVLDISTSTFSLGEVTFTKEKIYNFLDIMAIDFKELKLRTKENQEYNENWSYTINPLRATPFIWKDSGKNKIICPIPKFILKKITEGVYFDFINNKFPNEYGNAFEKYLYEITSAVTCCGPINLKIKVPSPYKVNKNKKMGADLIFYDESSAMIIESKCKRLRLEAQYKLCTDSIHNELKNMAKYIVQNYKNIEDISKNITDWDPEGRVLFSAIVTLTDWNLFTSYPYDYIEMLVDNMLQDQAISLEVKSQFPYIIMSASEYEISIKIIEKIGIKVFFEKILEFRSNVKGLNLMNVIAGTFPEELREWENNHNISCFEPMCNFIEQEIKEYLE